MEKANIEKLKEISTPAIEDWFQIEEKWNREDNGYTDYGLMYDDDKKSLIGGYFAPNGDWYLTLQSIDEKGMRSWPVTFRLSLYGSHIPSELKRNLIECIKQLPKETEF